MVCLGPQCKDGRLSGRVNADTGEGGLGCSARGRGNTSRPLAEHPRPPSPVTALTLYPGRCKLILALGSGGLG